MKWSQKVNYVILGYLEKKSPAEADMSEIISTILY